MEFQVSRGAGSVVGVHEGQVARQESFEAYDVGDVTGECGLTCHFLLQQDADVVDLNGFLRRGLVDLESPCSLFKQSIMFKAPEGIADRGAGYAKPLADCDLSKWRCRRQGTGKYL